MMKIIYALLLIVAFSSCKNDPQYSVQNGNFKVEFLFEQDGCKMYRFADGGRNVYWSDCRGKIQSDYTTRSGKSTTTHHQESITTN